MNQSGFTQVVKTVEDASALLIYIRNLIKKNNYLFARRSKNTETILVLGITAKQVREIIYDLEATDYCSGPDEDKDFPGKQVAVFGYDYNGTELYIKFSFAEDGSPIVILSFHEPEYLMKYPF